MVAKSYTQLVSEMNKSVSIAVKNASNRLLEVLKTFIQEDYYNMYEPLYYERTNMFMSSAVAEMLGQTSASIGISDAFMNYEYQANYRLQDNSNGHWTGEDQVYMANAGFHGNAYIYRDGHFWKDFEDYCDKHALEILREELRKAGLNIV